MFIVSLLNKLLYRFESISINAEARFFLHAKIYMGSPRN